MDWKTGGFLLLIILFLVGYNIGIAQLWTNRGKRSQLSGLASKKGEDRYGGMWNKVKNINSVDSWLSDAEEFESLSSEVEELIAKQAKEEQNES